MARNGRNGTEPPGVDQQTTMEAFMANPVSEWAAVTGGDSVNDPYPDRN
jgi:hypothetical protein